MTEKMKPDRLDQSYKILKLSCSLFAVTLVATLFKRTFSESLQELVDLFIAIPILVASVISTKGLYLAIRGSQYGQRNAKKRFFALFGNLMFVAIIAGMIIMIFKDIQQL